MKLLCFFILIFPLVSFSQTGQPITYTDVITVDSAKQSDLFTRARQWLNESFKSAKDVIQIADKESGEISAKGFTEVTATYHSLGTHNSTVDVWFSINIWVKDGKYKYELKDFDAKDHTSNTDYGILTSDEDYPYKGSPMTKKIANDVWKSTKESTKTEIDSLVASLKASMKKKASSDF